MAEVESTPAPNQGREPLTTEDVLRDEIEALHGLERPDALKGDALYQVLFERNAIALCLSGGGIRSASFALGVIQALAAHPRPSPTTSVATAEASFLAKFHYLSTVSGGGYIGGWLSAWLTRVDFPTVWRNLVGRPAGVDVEPPVISWLRAYSNFLTPKIGVMSADAWAALALVLRNMLLNWLVILPVLCAGLVVVKLYAMGVAWFSQLDPRDGTIPSGALAVGVLFLLAALWFTHGQRPAHCASRADQRGFLYGSLSPAVLAGMAFSLTLASPYAHNSLYLTPWFSGPDELFSSSSFVARGLACGVLVYLGAWLPTLPRWQMWNAFSSAIWQRRWSDLARELPGYLDWREVRRDLVAVIGAGAFFGVLMALAIWIYFKFWDSGIPYFGRAEILLVILAVPWTLFSQLIAEMIFVGLSSYEQQSDSDREWLGRAAGWYIVTAVAWIAVTFLVFLAATVAANVYKWVSAWISGLGAGGVAAWLAKSRATPAKGDAKSAMALSFDALATIAAMIFGAFLVVMASALLDLVLLDAVLIESAHFRAQVVENGYPSWPGGGWLPIGLFVALLVAWGASYFININRFSLHALYRNRLIRAFLGASHAVQRRPNPFTDFDLTDNLRVKELWPPRDMWAQLRGGYKQPFHIVNMALNIVSTKRKAWQERKAETFTVSPLHCGSACYGLTHLPDGALRAHGAFRASDSYGDEDGISLGTAVAISGAAASPNMGYNSSPALAFLMTMFNVRLGWWLGNPEKTKTIYASEGPRLAIQPLFAEMFGLTDDESNYVYLSDGGHFENLALYEMVRRRCRFIIVSDAGCDSKFAFEDLGNAVRKISLDLGVSIAFHGLSILKSRAEEERLTQCCPHGATMDTPNKVEWPALHAIGVADYGGGKKGVILYVKAAYHARTIQNVGVRSYAIAHPAFPHESTGDQFFSESQFESYRALGYEMMDEILKWGTQQLADPASPTLDGILEALYTEAVNNANP